MTVRTAIAQTDVQQVAAGRCGECERLLTPVFGRCGYSRGGDLGTFGRGMLPPEIEGRVFSLKDGEISEVPITDTVFGRQAEITELYEAVMHGAPMFHDGRWGEATLEVCLGMLQSSAERREIQMSHQVPVPAGH